MPRFDSRRHIDDHGLPPPPPENLTDELGIPVPDRSGRRDLAEFVRRAEARFGGGSPVGSEADSTLRLEWLSNRGQFTDSPTLPLFISATPLEAKALRALQCRVEELIPVDENIAKEMRTFLHRSSEQPLSKIISHQLQRFDGGLQGRYGRGGYLFPDELQAIRTSGEEELTANSTSVLPNSLREVRGRLCGGLGKSGCFWVRDQNGELYVAVDFGQKFAGRPVTELTVRFIDAALRPERLPYDQAAAQDRSVLLGDVKEYRLKRITEAQLYARLERKFPPAAR